MDTIINNIYESVKDYFESLQLLGYNKQYNVNALLTYIFIGDILNGDMRFFVTEKDYAAIDKVLHCLYGSSCLIPYPKFIAPDNNLYGTLLDNTFLVPRITEDASNNLLRFTEDNSLRFKATTTEEEIPSTTDYNS